VVLAAVLLVAGPVGAQERSEATSATGFLESLSLGGSVRGAYWSSSRNLDDRTHLGVGAVWLDLTGSLGSAVRLDVEGWVADQDIFRAEDPRAEVQQGYLDVKAGPLDLRAGQQIIAWGRADRLNPTDILTPRDFTLLVPDDDDQRLGVPALRVTYYTGPVSLIGIVLPVFRPHRLPRLQLPSGFTLQERQPEDPVAQWAVKLDYSGGGLDGSVSYYDGYDLFPDLSIDKATPAAVDLVYRYHRVQMIGADLATAVGPFGLRGEAAYVLTRDRSGTDPEIKNPYLFVILGADRTFAEHLYANVQYLLRVVVGFHSAQELANPLERQIATREALINNQLDHVQHGFSARIGYRWLNDTLRAELEAVAWITRFNYLVRPKVIYAITDRWTVTAGADVFGGPRESFFGQLRDDTTAYLEVRWSF
jgi:uncharacterized protein DUF1302